MHAVGVDVEAGPVHIAARHPLVQQHAGPLLERTARQEAGHRVVAGIDDAGSTARQQVGEHRVTAAELRRRARAEQRQHTGGPAGGIAQGARQHAV